jgi:hypothetical protein
MALSQEMSQQQFFPTEQTVLTEESNSWRNQTCVPEENHESIDGEKCTDHLLDRLQSTQSKEGFVEDVFQPLLAPTELPKVVEPAAENEVWPDHSVKVMCECCGKRSNTQVRRKLRSPWVLVFLVPIFLLPCGNFMWCHEHSCENCKGIVGVTE